MGTLSPSGEVGRSCRFLMLLTVKQSLALGCDVCDCLMKNILCIPGVKSGLYFSGVRGLCGVISEDALLACLNKRQREKGGWSPPMVD